MSNKTFADTAYRGFKFKEKVQRVGVEWVYLFVLAVGTFYQPQCKPMGNSLTSKIFIKSAEYLTSVKFGVMITWVNTIVQKVFRCHSNKR